MKRQAGSRQAPLWSLSLHTQSLRASACPISLLCVLLMSLSCRSSPCPTPGLYYSFEIGDGTQGFTWPRSALLERRFSSHGPLFVPSIALARTPSHYSRSKRPHSDLASYQEGRSNRKLLMFSGPSGCKQQLALSWVRAEDQTELGLSSNLLSNQ